MKLLDTELVNNPLRSLVARLSLVRSLRPTHVPSIVYSIDDIVVGRYDRFHVNGEYFSTSCCIQTPTARTLLMTKPFARHAFSNQRESPRRLQAAQTRSIEIQNRSKRILDKGMCCLLRQLGQGNTNRDLVSWEVDDVFEKLQENDFRCAVTGIPLTHAMLSMDRITDEDSLYCLAHTTPMLHGLNMAKGCMKRVFRNQSELQKIDPIA